jgi:hypothetical protein
MQIKKQDIESAFFDVQMCSYTNVQFLIQTDA